MLVDASLIKDVLPVVVTSSADEDTVSLMFLMSHFSIDATYILWNVILVPFESLSIEILLLELVVLLPAFYY